MQNFGVLSLLPVAVVIVLVFLTRRTAVSLLAGTVVGAVLCCVGSTLGLLLAAYLVSAQAYGSLSPLNLLIFLITWLAPVWFLSGWVHRY